jgi:hypothetical protein
MRRSILFILFTAAALTTFLLLPLHARHARQRFDENGRQHIAQLQNLHVTDLCLTTEARYTRHPAMADRHAPFQEHPLALEHFPSGSLIMPNMTDRNKP